MERFESRPAASANRLPIQRLIQTSMPCRFDRRRELSADRNARSAPAISVRLKKPCIGVLGRGTATEHFSLLEHSCFHAPPSKWPMVLRAIKKRRSVRGATERRSSIKRSAPVARATDQSARWALASGRKHF